MRGIEGANLYYEADSRQLDALCQYLLKATDYFNGEPFIGSEAWRVYRETIWDKPFGIQEKISFQAEKIGGGNIDEDAILVGPDGDVILPEEADVTEPPDILF